MRKLRADELRRSCDPDQFDFETTEELRLEDKDLIGAMGQERAHEAFRLGTGITKDGYNLYVMGPAGTGKHSFVFRALRERARHESPPPDLCYVNNFQDPNRPTALSLPAGRGREFAADVDELITELNVALTAAFESEEYRGSKKAVEEDVKQRHDVAFRELQRRAEERGVKLVRTPEGLVFAPFREGHILTPDEFKSMSDEKREQIQQHASEFHDQLHGFLQNLPDWEKSGHERIKELDRKIAHATVARVMSPLLKKYSGMATALGFLNEAQREIVENYSDFVRGRDESRAGALATLAAITGGPGNVADSRGGEGQFRRYRVNLLVENDPKGGAPVIYEESPTYQNLIGRVEHLAQMGALITDFTLIKPGALHRASGGYLVLDAYKLFLQPFAWEGLKQALRSRELRIETPGQLVSLVTTVSLEPEPIPQDTQVVLIGERFLFYMLNHIDPDFPELFKVPVDFEEQLPRTVESSESYALLIGSLARKNNLLPLTREAVARVIEEGARIAGDAEKLTARVGSVADLLREADFWAKETRHNTIGPGDVQRAIEGQVRRSSRIRDRLLEETRRGIVLIETDGRLVGGVNGLAYIDQGNFAFGHPTRITARVRLGRGDVVDIEREAKLGGPIHSKGVLILSGFLGSRYALHVPLSFAATLVFEQSYGMIEGDSASSAELYALLSALADLPIDQSLAVTGAVNQYGDVQAIGGVNEKIEGFFDLCHARGLTGRQGVLIPSSNVTHLMLRRDIAEAVYQGLFSVFPVSHVDEGLELLTGVRAGVRDESGFFPLGTVNRKVEERLIRLAEERRAFGLQMQPSGEINGNKAA